MQKYILEKMFHFKRFLREVKEISHVQQDRIQELGPTVFRLHVLVQHDSFRG